MAERMDILKELFALGDAAYREFHTKLIPTVDADTVIGVRAPLLRALAKRMGADKEAFLKALPHTYYEENALHAFLVSAEPSFERCIAHLDAFLPYVDNWAVCDGIRPKSFAKNREKLLPEIEVWLQSPHPYTVRFAMEMLMVHYLEEAFATKHLAWVSGVSTEEYYVRMMRAWYFATALAKQWESTLPYITEGRLDKWVHNKTIQKAVESNRITAAQKAVLRAYRRK